ncbi:SAM-dependent methyltransferase [Streptomyces sp. NPDC004051]
MRSPQEIASFFAGLDLVQPGVVSTAAWRPDADRAEEDTADVSVCGVAVEK